MQKDSKIEIKDTKIIGKSCTFFWSIHFSCLILRCKRGKCCCSSVVEHFLGKEEVTSSSLVNSSTDASSEGRPKAVPRRQKDNRSKCIWERLFFCCIADCRAIRSAGICRERPRGSRRGKSLFSFWETGLSPSTPHPPRPPRTPPPPAADPPKLQRTIFYIHPLAYWIKFLFFGTLHP